MTTVNGWESLVVETKISILVTLGALDSSLCEIKMSRLNKQILLNILLKFIEGDTVVSDFSDYCSNSLENENTLTTERRKHFTEAATEMRSSNLCLAAIIKIIKKCL